MATVTRYAPGTLSWVELASPDGEVTRRFYGELFGWYAYTMTSDLFGDIVIFTLGDTQDPGVAGMQELADDAQPPSWTCYFKADVGSGIEAVQGAGGQVLSAMIEAHLGRSVLVADPQGAGFGLWEPYTSAQAGSVGEPGTVCWVELACRDFPDAHRFYAAVFGWEPEARRLHHGAAYTDWRLADQTVGGMVLMDEQWPPSYPAHWMPYFEVADCDAAAAKAVGLGARIQIPPTDVGAVRYSILTDPTGARLGIAKPAPAR